MTDRQDCRSDRQAAHTVGRQTHYQVWKRFGERHLRDGGPLRDARPIVL